MECDVISKSTYQGALTCAWRQDQFTNHHIKSISSPPARRGNKAHKYKAKIDRGEMDFEEAEAQLMNDPDGDGPEVVDLVQGAINADPIMASITDDERKSLEIEKWRAVDSSGKAVSNRAKAVIHGYIDRSYLRADGTVVVDDLKTGWMEADFALERYFYVALAMGRFPDAKKIQFAYLYARTGHYPVWTYHVKSKGEIVETTPDEKYQEHKFRKNPFVVYAENALEKVRGLPVVPTPGPHCENMYGAPCQFLGKECPLAQQTAQVTEKAIEKATGQPSPTFEMLQGIIDGKVTDKESVEKALAGQMQMQAWLKSLDAAIKAWSQANGLIQLGNDQYGWFSVPENDVDKAFALSEMLRSEMTVEEIAHVVSIAKTSLDNKISKRKYPLLREGLLKMAVSQVDSKPKFGLIKPDAAAAIE